MMKANLLPRRAFLACLALALAAPAGASRADDDDGIDQDDVMSDVQAGRILPLSAIRSRIAGRIAGDIVRVRVRRDDGRLIYKLRLITPAGRLVEAELDAVTGAILEIEND